MQEYSIDKTIEQLNINIKKILQDNLVGIYYHGSIAFGCFNPDISDLDFVIVVKNKINGNTKKEIVDFLIENENLAPKKGFEMSVVLERYCNNFEYPTPYELHYSDSWKKRYILDNNMVINDNEKTDYDLAAHFTIVKEAKPIVFGKAVKEVFGEVKKEYYTDSILRDIENAEEDILKDTMYTTLNLCRVLAYLSDNKILSKEQGGIWGIENCEERYKELLTQALIQYKEGIDIKKADEFKIEFSKYMKEMIMKRKKKWRKIEI